MTITEIAPAPAFRRRSVLASVGVAAALSGVAQLSRPQEASAATGNDPALHLLRRATFGPTPALLAKVRQQGISAWLDAQLNPTSVDDPVIDGLLSRWPLLNIRTWECREKLPSIGSSELMYDLQEAHVSRALWSERQLLEVVVDFWTNHLVVPVPVSDVWDNSHLFSRDVIRKHALGKYVDMLLASAKHPAMLKVLDNADSTKKSPNENYGREVLELHSVGFGNYTETDMRNAALALTGLSVDSENGLYEFKPERRYVGAVKVLGWSSSNTSPEGGEAVALSLVAFLARHELTARRIVTKLVVRFVSDSPPESLINKLITVYMQNDTAVAPVLRALFTSTEFAASAEKKYKTPYEDVLSTMRLFDAKPEVEGAVEIRNIIWALRAMGQEPMGWPAPNGYPDVAAAWAGAASTLARWNFHLGLAGGWGYKAIGRIPVSSLLPTQIPSSYGAFVEALADRLLIPTLSAAQKSAVCLFVGHGSGDAIKVTDPAMTYRLVYVVSLLLDSYNFSAR